MSPELTRSYSHRVTRCFFSDLAVAGAPARVVDTPRSCSPTAPPRNYVAPGYAFYSIFLWLGASVLTDITAFWTRKIDLSSASPDTTTAC